MKTIEFEVKLNAGKLDVRTKKGSCLVYDDAELGKLKAAGLKDGHAVLLNQIVKIRAMDAVRKTMEDTSPKAALNAALKADPGLMTRVLAMMEAEKLSK